MMQRFETIRLEIDALGIARLVLNRPDNHNALSARMIDEITEGTTLLAANAEVRVVVLSANGPSFCAGGDLLWMKNQFEADRATLMYEASRLSNMYRALDELQKLLITLVEGPAFGGGVGIVATSDVVLAAEGVKFALSETRLGLIPATVAPFVLRRIGLTGMRRFGLNASTFGADDARAIGLVSEVHARHDLKPALQRHLEFARACDPGAIADAKQLFRQIAAGLSSQTDTIAALADRWETEEGRQGIEAFIEHRRPPWSA
jgi:methylglutaconyl-CoA hydratase